MTKQYEMVESFSQIYHSAIVYSHLVKLFN